MSRRRCTTTPLDDVDRHRVSLAAECGANFSETLFRLRLFLRRKRLKKLDGIQRTENGTTGDLPTLLVSKKSRKMALRDDPPAGSASLPFVYRVDFLSSSSLLLLSSSSSSSSSSESDSKKLLKPANRSWHLFGEPLFSMLSAGITGWLSME